MKKRSLSLLVVLAMLIGLLIVPAGAAPSAESVRHADCLNALHLFQGTNSGYQLENTPTRLQCLIMLIRLIGVEEEALACTKPNPFTDITYGVPYVAYAYDRQLTLGVSKTKFAPNDPLDASGYTVFLLRALGYNDTNGDFTYGQQLGFAASISLMTAQAAEALAQTSVMTRGDMVDLSYAALTCRVNGENRTLAEKLRDNGVFTQAEGEAAGVLGANAGWIFDRSAPAAPAVTSGSGVSYEVKKVSTSGGELSARVLTVDTKDPKVHVKTAMVNNTLGATAPFKDIVQSSGALAVVNGNFFNSYDAFKTPIGHVMVDGQFLYGNSGISSLGITSSGELRVGRPALFTRLRSGDTTWAAYAINVEAQAGSVLYTPAYGRAVEMQKDGHVMTVIGGVISSYQPAAAGTSLPVPAGGLLVFMDHDFTSTNYFHEPVVGMPLTTEYYLQTEDAEGFTLDGVTSIVSGAPRLVQDGVIVTTLEPGFTEARFTTSSSPRTAVGVDGSGKLVLVTVSSATIQQMRELMLNLGCVDAFNLDGGASCGMYYNGSYVATPGRELTVTLQVFMDP